jgi:hypothetical protein
VTGHGAGVRNSFTYHGWGLDHPWEIYRFQADRQFSRTVRTVVTIDGDNRTRLLHRASAATMSPWEGRIGMMLEFETTDWDGLRTSLGYAFEGAMIHLGTAATLRVLGEWQNDAAGHDIEQRMPTGRNFDRTRTTTTSRSNRSRTRSRTGWGASRPMFG